MKNVLILAMGLVIVSLVGGMVYEHNEIAVQKGEDAKVALVASLLTKPSPRPLEQVIVDGDEMPGIGADSLHPDLCKAYWGRGHAVHLQYADTTSMHVGDSLLQADIRNGKAIEVSRK